MIYEEGSEEVLAKWTPEEEAKLASLYLKVPLETLVREFPRHSLGAIIAKGNKVVYGDVRTWSPYEDEILVNEYGRLSAKKLKSMYLPHRSVVAIQNRTRKLGLRKQTEIVYNETFFDYWTPELAYALGLLLTDGRIYSYRSQGNYGAAWLLKKDDSVPLFMLQQLFGGIIHDHKGVCYQLCVFGRWIVEKLQALGVDLRRKAEREYFPDIPKEYEWHFIRGLVDGDGWVNNTWKKGRFCVGFCGRKWAVDWVAQRWEEALRKPVNVWKRAGNYSIEVYNASAMMVCKKIYEMCGLLYIPRKRNAYLEACRDYSRKGSRGAVELSETGGSPETNRTEDIVQPEEQNSG